MVKAGCTRGVDFARPEWSSATCRAATATAIAYRAQAEQWSRCGLLFLIFAGDKVASSHFKAGQELDVALVAADAALADAVFLR
jgi:hypothetical protein